MILVLGASGYIGRAFCAELRQRGLPFVPLSRIAFDYTQFNLLFEYVHELRPTFLINAAGYCGRPNVDAGEQERMVTFLANAVLPQTVARVCLATNTPWGHVSSGSIYSGAKIFENGRMRVVENLNSPEVRRLFEAQPDRFFGFTEFEEPNSTFRRLPCSFFGGTKALAEEVMRDFARCYIWRLCVPFAEQDEPCNLLSRLWRGSKVYDQVGALSHRGDFVKACLELWDQRAPFGTYNVANPGALTTRQVVAMMRENLTVEWRPPVWGADEEFSGQRGGPAHSSCILDMTKLLSAGVRMRPVKEALAVALRAWRPAAEQLRLIELDSEAAVER